MTGKRARGRRRSDDHGHSHAPLSPEAIAEVTPRSARVRWTIGIALGVFAAAAVAVMIWLWPGGQGVELPEGYQSDRTRVELTAIENCPADEGCQLGTAEIDGKDTEVRLPIGDTAPEFHVGDKIVANKSETPDGATTYTFSDFDRTSPLLWLSVLFVAAVLVLSRWKGVASLVSLGFTLIVVTQYILPALLKGENPLLVALSASVVIMTIAVYVSHGVNLRSSVALFGTLLALGVAGALGSLFTSLGQFTGFSDESLKYLAAVLGDIDVRGLLLAGLIIGALGVLDDVTITQTAAVWEIAAADPGATRWEVFASAMRIGRDHVSALVNTLVLAYVGASLPILLLLTAVDTSAHDMLVSEGIGQEVVRSLVGSLGIIAAVPITTGLACAVVSLHPRHPESS